MHRVLCRKTDCTGFFKGARSNHERSNEAIIVKLRRFQSQSDSRLVAKAVAFRYLNGGNGMLCGGENSCSERLGIVVDGVSLNFAEFILATNDVLLSADLQSMSAAPQLILPHR